MNNLLNKAVDIKGKAYILVKDRVIFFAENFHKGSITTELLSRPEDKVVVVKATVTDGTGRTFTGHSQAVVGEGYINKTAALENAETSAVGRALAMMGIGVIDSIASADEINKASYTVNKIQSGQKFTADEYEEAQTILPDEAYGATKQASKDWRAANPPVKRNPGVKYGKIATGNMLKENLLTINKDEI